MQFNSVSALLGNEDTLTLENAISKLLDIRGAVTELNIVSAYWDIKAIRAAFEWACKHQDKRKSLVFRVYVDKSANRLVGNDDAINLAKSIAEICSQTSGVFLVKSPTLFHSKAVVVISNLETKFAIGSMNFTTMALTKNEEILLMATVENSSKANKVRRIFNQVESYLFDLTARSSSLLEKEPLNTSNDLQQFLLNGFLIYEAKASEPFGLKLGLPSKILKISSSFSGLLEGSIPDVLPIDKLIQRNIKVFGITELNKNELIAARWKKYCVLTSYGYWSHNSFDESIQSVIQSRSDSRKTYYEHLKEVLNTRKTEIAMLVFEYCEQINRDVLLSHPNERWVYFENAKNTYALKQKIEKSIQRASDRLNIKLFFNRLVQGVNFAKVPALYNDIDAREEFENSFVEDLKEKLSKIDLGLKRTNQISSMFFNGLEESGYTEIGNFDKDVLEEYLASGCVDEWFSADFDPVVDGDEE